MTIKTLEHIHRLLIQDVKKHEEVYRPARDTLTEITESGIYNREEIQKYRDSVEEYYELLSEARGALHEFEEKEW